ncbi:hypothetical protein CABS01_01337 [Colletotrichum abscissum]|uniref:Uncharacterized protein n=1 Tax=Colletotrichum abscissum TaxID=1671311 RepID=A0A9P9XFV1_9PEZI|nr:uncharacterized protein CABS01_01337 [Colletotrichum abscissum]KAI3553184.1 hypothetical protein CABS02_06539 [Colletotrichum abscissum]KAK1505869.1 hypothetical protein CABS01_01337 [Colletotrichum abscissum]
MLHRPIERGCHAWVFASARRGNGGKLNEFHRSPKKHQSRIKPVNRNIRDSQKVAARRSRTDGNKRHSVRRAFKEYREPLSSGGLRSGMYQSFPRAAASEAVASAQERQIKSRASPPGPGPPPSVVSGAGGERTPMRCQQLEDLGL